MPTKKSETEVSQPMRILAIGTCPTLSEKSTLTYHIGCNSQQEVQFRIHANSGGGLFSNEWVSFNDIQQKLEKLPEDASITSIILNSLLRGKSANTPGFIMAVLKAEGLLLAKGKRSHEKVDSQAFLDRMQQLIAGGTDIKVPEPEKKTKPVKPAKPDASPANAKPKATAPTKGTAKKESASS